MARVVCVTPPLTGVLPNIVIPFMGTGLTSQPAISYAGGTAGCDGISALLSQLSPMMGAMGMPICLMGCLGAVIAFVNVVPDSLVPPNPGKLISAVENVAKQCQCVVEIALPPPIGVICEFLQMMSGILTLIDQTVDCAVGLITGIVTIQEKGTALLADALTAAAGHCAVTTAQGMMDLVNAKLGPLTTLTAAIEPILELLSAVPGASSAMMPVIAGIEAISGNPSGTSPAATLSALNSFKTVLDTAAQAMATVAAVCP